MFGSRKESKKNSNLGDPQKLLLRSNQVVNEKTPDINGNLFLDSGKLLLRSNQNINEKTADVEEDLFQKSNSMNSASKSAVPTGNPNEKNDSRLPVQSIEKKKSNEPAKSDVNNALPQDQKMNALRANEIEEKTKTAMISCLADLLTKGVKKKIDNNTTVTGSTVKKNPQNNNNIERGEAKPDVKEHNLSQERFTSQKEGNLPLKKSDVSPENKTRDSNFSPNQKQVQRDRASLLLACEILGEKSASTAIEDKLNIISKADSTSSELRKSFNKEPTSFLRQSIEKSNDVKDPEQLMSKLKLLGSPTLRADINEEMKNSTNSSNSGIERTDKNERNSENNKKVEKNRILEYSKTEVTSEGKINEKSYNLNKYATQVNQEKNAEEKSGSECQLKQGDNNSKGTAQGAKSKACSQIKCEKKNPDSLEGNFSKANSDIAKARTNEPRLDNPLGVRADRKLDVSPQSFENLKNNKATGLENSKLSQTRDSSQANAETSLKRNFSPNQIKNIQNDINLKGVDVKIKDKIILPSGSEGKHPDLENKEESIFKKVEIDLGKNMQDPNPDSNIKQSEAEKEGLHMRRLKIFSVASAPNKGADPAENRNFRQTVSQKMACTSATDQMKNIHQSPSREENERKIVLNSESSNELVQKNENVEFNGLKKVEENKISRVDVKGEISKSSKDKLDEFASVKVPNEKGTASEIAATKTLKVQAKTTNAESEVLPQTTPTLLSGGGLNQTPQEITTKGITDEVKKTESDNLKADGNRLLSNESNKIETIQTPKLESPTIKRERGGSKGLPVMPINELEKKLNERRSRNISASKEEAVTFNNTINDASTKSVEISQNFEKDLKLRKNNAEVVVDCKDLVKNTKDKSVELKVESKTVKEGGGAYSNQEKGAITKEGKEVAKEGSVELKDESKAVKEIGQARSNQEKGAIATKGKEIAKEEVVKTIEPVPESQKDDLSFNQRMKLFSTTDAKIIKKPPSIINNTSNNTNPSKPVPSAERDIETKKQIGTPASNFIGGEKQAKKAENPQIEKKTELSTANHKQEINVLKKQESNIGKGKDDCDAKLIKKGSILNATREDFKLHGKKPSRTFEDTELLNKDLKTTCGKSNFKDELNKKLNFGKMPMFGMGGPPKAPQKQPETVSEVPGEDKFKNVTDILMDKPVVVKKQKKTKARLDFDFD